jgi:hypothetical protein
VLASAGIAVASAAVAIDPGHQYLLYLFPSCHLFQPSPETKELRNPPDQTQLLDKQHQMVPHRRRHEQTRNPRWCWRPFYRWWSFFGVGGMPWYMPKLVEKALLAVTVTMVPHPILAPLPSMPKHESPRTPLSLEFGREPAIATGAHLLCHRRHSKTHLIVLSSRTISNRNAV